MCFTAGRFGVIPFSVHSIAYQILPLCYMIPLGFSIGLSVRMGALFSNSVQKVKYLVAIVLVFIFVLAATVASFIYFSRDFVISLFTEDEEVILVSFFCKECIFLSVPLITLSLRIICENSND